MIVGQPLSNSLKNLGCSTRAALILLSTEYGAAHSGKQLRLNVSQSADVALPLRPIQQIRFWKCVQKKDFCNKNNLAKRFTSIYK